MQEQKYPYIPEKKMYAAVQTASEKIAASYKEIVNAVAKQYSVDPIELRKLLKERERINHTPQQEEAKKFKYYAVITSGYQRDDHKKYFVSARIKKAMSKHNAVKDYELKDKDDFNAKKYFKVFDNIIAECDTKDEAMQKLGSFFEENNVPQEKRIIEK